MFVGTLARPGNIAKVGVKRPAHCLDVAANAATIIGIQDRALFHAGGYSEMSRNEPLHRLRRCRRLQCFVVPEPCWIRVVNRLNWKLALARTRVNTCFGYRCDAVRCGRWTAAPLEARAPVAHCNPVRGNAICAFQASPGMGSPSRSPRLLMRIRRLTWSRGRRGSETGILPRRPTRSTRTDGRHLRWWC